MQYYPVTFLVRLPSKHLPTRAATSFKLTIRNLPVSFAFESTRVILIYIHKHWPYPIPLRTLLNLLPELHSLSMLLSLT